MAPVLKSAEELKRMREAGGIVAIAHEEMRRAIESLPPEQYEALSYYEKWTAALEILLIEKGILTAAEIDAKAAELRERGL